MLLFLLYFNINYYIENIDRVKYGYINCIDEGLYKTCIFKNIYYYNNRWIIYSNTYNSTNLCLNIYSQQLYYCWKPFIYSYNEYHNISLPIEKVYYDLSIPFLLTYKKNYGHAFWDDLYAVYTSIVKCGYKNEKFNLVIPNNYKVKEIHFLNDIYNVAQKFSKGSNIYLNRLKNNIILFKTLIVGSSHHCQRCVTTDYSLKYSREYNITRLFRDRMYEVYNIIPKYENPIEGIIVDNKRYNDYEKGVLQSIIKHFKRSKIIKLSYIDFRNYTTFYNQLKLLSRIHIYISGPGTGLMNFPFIPDPGVVIHLGHIHFGCPQYLEQYMLEGSPHYKAFYYSPEKRMKRMNYSYVINLIENAYNYIKSNKRIYIQREENLNSIGKLFVKICRENKEVCERLISNYDWGYGKCRGIWAENVVYFPSLYTKISELKKIVELYNSTQNLGCKVGINYSKQKQCK